VCREIQISIGDAKMLKRLKRLAETFIAKKYVAWVVATYLLVSGFIAGAEWVMLTTGIFVIDAYSKTKLAPEGAQ